MMQLSREFFYSVSNRLVFLAAFPLLITFCTGGELSESKSFSKFIRSVDPQNVLGVKWNEMPLINPCLHKWNGVKCDLNGSTILQIRLENSNLSGIIDGTSLCKLQNLQILNLAGNLIHGNIPNSMWHCTKLRYLNLSSNRLRGRVPMALTKLNYLSRLDISNNHFVGPIPNIEHRLKNAYKLHSLKQIELQRKSTLNSIEEKDSGHEPSASPEPSKSSSHNKLYDYLMIVVLFVGIGLIFLFTYLVRKKNAKLARERETLKGLRESPTPLKILPAEPIEVKPEERCSELVFFTGEDERFKLEDLLEATADLRSQNMCSSLYKVILRNNASYAVKRLKKLQVSFEEFGQTMKQIGEMKHPNILPLVGYNSTNDEKLLIYKYQANGSLLSLLESYVEGKRDFPWRLRLSIATGIARGLAFIYQRFDEQEIIPHGNLKLSNILLNEYMEPMISEYGITRFLDSKKTCLLSSHGYTAPENRLTEQGDVYSFGIILLELLTGKAVEKSGIDLPKWVRSKVKEEWTGEVFDREVNSAARQWAFPLLNISLKCVSNSPQERPTMMEVLEKIEAVLNAHEDHSISSQSSTESVQHECCLLHTVIPETWDTPGSNY